MYGSKSGVDLKAFYNPPFLSMYFYIDFYQELAETLNLLLFFFFKEDVSFQLKVTLVNNHVSVRGAISGRFCSQDKHLSHAEFWLKFGGRP